MAAGNLASCQFWEQTPCLSVIDIACAAVVGTQPEWPEATCGKEQVNGNWSVDRDIDRKALAFPPCLTEEASMVEIRDGEAPRFPERLIVAFRHRAIKDKHPLPP
jgi:hypothetical protein